MPELGFSVVDVAPERYAASPLLVARVRVEETTEATVHAIALRAQVRIDASRRPYDQAEADGLTDLFGGRERWATTLRPLLWMHTTAMVPGFRGAAEVDLPLAITYDFEVAAAKYLHAVRGGDIPLSFMFSGTVFTRGATDFQVHQIPWSCEADHRMPAAVWHQAMEAFFPGGGWIRVPRSTLDALQRFKSDRGLPTWEEAFAVLLGAERPGAAVVGPEAALRATADGGTP